MYYGVNPAGEKVNIEYSLNNVEYHCPACKGLLVRKMGMYKAHHFAHKAAECDPWYHDSKGVWHKHMQELFPQECCEVCKFNEQEDFHIADVLISKPDGHNLIIEFQHSAMSHQEWLERTIFWRSHGDDIIWVFDITDKEVYQVPDYPEWFWWTRPTLTLDRLHIYDVPIIFYTKPVLHSEWFQNFHYCGKTMTHSTYSIIDTPQTQNEGTRYILDTYTATLPNSFQFQHSNIKTGDYHLLHGTILSTDDEFLQFIQKRLLYTPQPYQSALNEPGLLSDYALLWINFDNIQEYNKAYGHLRQLAQYSNQISTHWNARIIQTIIYVRDIHQIKYEPGFWYETAGGELLTQCVNMFGKEHVRATRSNEPR